MVRYQLVQMYCSASYSVVSIISIYLEQALELSWSRVSLYFLRSVELKNHLEVKINIFSCFKSNFL